MRRSNSEKIEVIEVSNMKTSFNIFFHVLPTSTQSDTYNLCPTKNYDCAEMCPIKIESCQVFKPCYIHVLHKYTYHTPIALIVFFGTEPSLMSTLIETN